MKYFIIHFIPGGWLVPTCAPWHSCESASRLPEAVWSSACRISSRARGNVTMGDGDVFPDFSSWLDAILVRHVDVRARFFWVVVLQPFAPS